MQQKTIILHYQETCKLLPWFRILYEFADKKYMFPNFWLSPDCDLWICPQ